MEASAGSRCRQPLAAANPVREIVRRHVPGVDPQEVLAWTQCLAGTLLFVGVLSTARRSSMKIPYRDQSQDCQYREKACCSSHPLLGCRSIARALVLLARNT